MLAEAPARQPLAPTAAVELSASPSHEGVVPATAAQLEPTFDQLTQETLAMTSVATLFATPLVDLLTGAIIKAGTSGNATKIAARATELVAINAALTKVLNGDTTGLNDLQVALNTSNLDPSEALALQSVFAAFSTKVAALGTLASGTLLGTAETTILTSLLSVATTCAQAYMTKYAPTVVTSTPASVVTSAAVVS